MSYYHTITPKSCLHLEHVRPFLRDHISALAKAAYKLGGFAASARVFLLCEAVGQTLRLTRLQRSQLVDLHRLLTLEHVGDPNRIESSLFAEIDPSSAFVEECCCMADELGALLVSIKDEESLSKGVDRSTPLVRKVA